MADSAEKLLTVDEYLAITAELDDDMKWELIDGVMTPKASRVVVENGVVAMTGGRWVHARIKTLAGFELGRAIAASELPCWVSIDGVGVAITDRTSYIPDIVVDSTATDPNACLASSPMIVIEVLSPSTRDKDVAAKLIGYFSLASVAHYLIVDPEVRDVKHHRRSPNGLVHTTHSGGALALDPPGLTVDLAAFFP